MRVEGGCEIPAFFRIFYFSIFRSCGSYKVFDFNTTYHGSPVIGGHLVDCLSHHRVLSALNFTETSGRNSSKKGYCANSAVNLYVWGSSSSHCLDYRMDRISLIFLGYTYIQNCGYRRLFGMLLIISATSSMMMAPVPAGIIAYRNPRL